MNRHTRRAAVLLGCAATIVTVVGTSGASTAAHGEGEVAFVQAVPSEWLPLTVDGKTIEKRVAGGTVIGPLALTPGTHDVVFGTGADAVSSTFEVTAGATSDLVLHRPAQVGGAPVVSVYPSPLDALGPDKARVILAHTATTAPADVRVDGKTVFTNIANGEYAQADLSAGKHEVALYPSGVDADAILGPITVRLKAGTLTAVYAVGNPTDMSMDVVVRTSGAGVSATRAPTQIDTGSAGLVDNVTVTPFSVVNPFTR